MEYPTVSQLKLREFPGYRVYGLNLVTGEECQRLIQKLNAGFAEVEFMSRYGNYTNYTSALFKAGKMSEKWDCEIKGAKPQYGSRLWIDPRCHIPATLLKRYQVVTSVTPDLPEYWVLPMNYAGVGRYKQMNHAVLFVDEINKVVLALDLPLDWGNYKELPRDAGSYVESVRNRMRYDIPDVDNFVPYDTGETYAICCATNDDTEYLYRSELLPQERIVSEYDLHVGEEDLPYDVFKSCYLMFQSTDEEMRKAALFTLSQYDCHQYFDLLNWMFNGDYDVYSAKSHKPFNWLHRCVTKDGNRFYSIRNRSIIPIGRQFVEDITEGKLKWRNGSLIMDENFKYRGYHLRRLVDLLN